MLIQSYSVTIVSILRLTSLVKFANTQNITCMARPRHDNIELTTNLGDYVPVGYWSTIEVHISVICACLPALPSLFRRKPKIVANGRTSEVGTPKNRTSDDFPLLKVASAHVRSISY
jgi:hypothetical protein